MSISLDIGSNEVKLIQLEKVNDDAAVTKISAKPTWTDMNSFDPEKLEKANWVACIKDLCEEVKLYPKKIKTLGLKNQRGVEK